MPTDGTQSETPQAILADAYERAGTNFGQPVVQNQGVQERIELVGLNQRNGAVVRLVLACTLAKAHQPAIDIRKPYTEIGDSDVYSGRSYDENYVTTFIQAHGLPCNPTTAFLTPALRNRNTTLLPDTNLVGRTPELYRAALQLLTDVQEETETAANVLAETLRVLLVKKHRYEEQMSVLMAGLKTVGEGIPLSSEGIVTLLEQHLKSPGSSRLPVLAVAAAYEAAGVKLGERIKPLGSHNAADLQTGAIGDVEVLLTNGDNAVTGYEMKTRRVTREDINNALRKIADLRVQNYIFITTDVIDQEVKEYAASLYEATGGVEVVVLDCLSFLRYFLHLFHRSRLQFLEAYQSFVLAEPESAVGQPLKVAWLALRQAAENALSVEE